MQAHVETLTSYRTKNQANHVRFNSNWENGRYVLQSKEDQNDVVEETGIKIILQRGNRGNINVVKSTD